MTRPDPVPASAASEPTDAPAGSTASEASEPAKRPRRLAGPTSGGGEPLGEPEERGGKPGGEGAADAPAGNTDHVLVQRERMRRLAVVGKRVGYLALLVAIVAFLVGVSNDLPGWSVALVVGGFAVATACLVPAIILGYAVKAAAREDRERDAQKRRTSRG